jgi:hypothetical protein
MMTTPSGLNRPVGESQRALVLASFSYAAIFSGVQFGVQIAVCARKKGPAASASPLNSMVAGVGLEPTTFGL